MAINEGSYGLTTGWLRLRSAMQETSHRRGRSAISRAGNRLQTGFGDAGEIEFSCPLASQLYLTYHSWIVGGVLIKVIEGKDYHLKCAQSKIRRTGWAESTTHPLFVTPLTSRRPGPVERRSSSGLLRDDSGASRIPSFGHHASRKPPERHCYVQLRGHTAR